MRRGGDLAPIRDGKRQRWDFHLCKFPVPWYPPWMVQHLSVNVTSRKKSTPAVKNQRRHRKHLLLMMRHGCGTAIKILERRAALRRRVDTGRERGFVGVNPRWSGEDSFRLRGRRQLWRHSGGHDACARRPRRFRRYGGWLQRRRH